MNIIYLLMFICSVVSLAIGIKNRTELKPNFGDYIVMWLIGASIGLAIGLIIVITLLLTH